MMKRLKRSWLELGALTVKIPSVHMMVDATSASDRLL